jgi:molybdopterin-containing oxidoreductase family membrane subunit
MYAWNGKVQDPAIMKRMKNLMGVFIIGSLYLVATYHMTNLYFAKQTAFEHFILLSGGIYPLLFWLGYVVLGSLVPLLLLYIPGLGPVMGKTRCVVAASLLVILGSFALLYVFIIGGQAFPLSIFPGFAASSTFADGQIGSYVPSLPEFALGIGGLGVAFLITIISVRVLDSLPHDAPSSKN